MEAGHLKDLFQRNSADRRKECFCSDWATGLSQEEEWTALQRETCLPVRPGMSCSN